MTLIIGSYMVTWLPIDMLFVWLCIYKTIESTAMGLMALIYSKKIITLIFKLYVGHPLLVWFVYISSST